ncbi:putative 4-coumarate--CoA ligase 3 [Frankliniella fusca]|uniref:4-coumarate--CoA ligase 3 n=1 Tax=Frankliniella fusca TaxID=407009 RepID=A0AAE1LFE3_9NEOP|nr:putative 4-coumarate--CoA ligase 3 [Frankliniella fusca]
MSSASTAALHVRTGPAAKAHPGVPLGAYILGALRQHAASALDIPAQVDSLSGRELSFPEMLRQSVQAAEGWRALGLGSGDTLAVFAFNNHHLYPAFFGAVLEGITVAIVKHSTAEELRGFLEKCGPKAILTEPSSLDVTLSVAGPRGLDLLHVVTADGALDVPQRDGDRVLTTRDLLARGAAADPAAYRPASVVDPKEHIAFLSFSSGTSGLPKMVRLSDYSFTMTLLFMTDWLVRPGDRVFITSQLAWITGLAFTLTCTVVGATRVFGWYDASASEVDWFGTLQRHRISTWFLAPPGLTLLAAEARARRARGQEVPMGSVRALLTSGTGLHADAQRHFAEVLDTPVVQWYGITEVGIVSSDGLPARPGSVGRLAPGVQLRLVDVESGLDIAAPNVLGEVRATAESLMSGYQGHPGGPAASLADVLDEHGFYRTGDLGYLDSDGFLFLVDRMKDSLKFDGVPISPAEVEAVLVSHPAVKEAAVVGRPHPRLVDVPTAFVVRQDGAGDVSEAELQDLVKDRLSYEKWLRGGVFFRDDIPKLTNGKVDRRALKDWLKTLPVPDCEL